MEIIKRDGKSQKLDIQKIKDAINKAFKAQNIDIESEKMDRLILDIESKLFQNITVEQIQDIVEEILMKHNYFIVAKAYILYRYNKSKDRDILVDFLNIAKDNKLKDIFISINYEFNYSLKDLYDKFKSFFKDNLTKNQTLKLIEKSCVELISVKEPLWENIAARFLGYDILNKVKDNEKKNGIKSFYDKINYLTKNKYYNKEILKSYSKDEIDELQKYIKKNRDKLFTYSGLDLIQRRYLILSKDDKSILERPQEMFMGISMHLCMKEKDRVFHAKKLYDALSTFKLTMATPTMSNARKEFCQLSSCFIDTVDDSLESIYKSLDNFAKISKLGGGMGLYFGKVRAQGSSIRGYKGAAGGVLRWLKLVNDTAIAVDQLGVRQGAAAVYLDVWHKDILEFLQIRTNNGDDRLKAHDIFPAICYPDLFYTMIEEDIEQDFYLMCPHEIYTQKGYRLEDYYGDEFTKKYFECVNDVCIEKRTIKLKELIRLIIKSLIETGTPFTFNKDIVNKMNPNKHQGMIYSSNLCTEILQNMSSIKFLKNEVIEDDGNSIVLNKTICGDFVVCNLASLNLSAINVNNQKELEEVISVAIRALDNVIDLTYYPIEYAKVSNLNTRPIGLGTSGYHQMLTMNNIAFESKEHLEFVDQVYENINYYAMKASMNLSKEKSPYKYFKGSDYENGDYFKLRNYTSTRWKNLQQEIKQYGLRNGYIMAIAPTGSTSIIAGTTQGIDPIMKKYFLEEKKGQMITRIAPGLNKENFWLYKESHNINQNYIIDAAGIRSRHIDQGQSVNIFITNDFTYRQILDLYIRAWKNNVKTIYYVRSQSLEVEDCVSCSS